MLNLSIDHAKHRVQFGRPIGEFQAIQHMLAEMATEIYAAHCMLYDVIEKTTQCYLGSFSILHFYLYWFILISVPFQCEDVSSLSRSLS
ncbi:acyl-CoA dehydrogenase family protein [Peribacillus simplex]|uniref:acyl-CoA dehydrogenase family protein n=1 Tax=Peribacillus TaxID=2675229 RepID=UPI0036DCCDD2